MFISGCTCHIILEQGIPVFPLIIKLKCLNNYFSSRLTLNQNPTRVRTHNLAVQRQPLAQSHWAGFNLMDSAFESINQFSIRKFESTSIVLTKKVLKVKFLSFYFTVSKTNNKYIYYFFFKDNFL